MVQKLVQRKHSYLLLRGNTFYFRYAYPHHLRALCPWLPAEVKRSLRTDSYTDALAMVNAKLPIIKLLRVCVDQSKVKELCALLCDFSSQFSDWVCRKFDAAYPSAVEVEKGTADTPKLSEVWDDFVNWKCWTQRRASENQRVFDNLLYFLGDVPVGTITKSDLKKALSSVAGLPARNKSPYKNMTLEEIVNSDIPEDDLLSSKSVKEHLKVAQGLFSSYLVRELDVLKSSPTEGLRWEVDDNRYACLTDSQVRKALVRAKAKPEWFWWFMMIAVYSGARRSEIASLEVTDFKLCSDTGRYYFVIHRGKTKAARRMVPLHDELLKAGVLDWLEGVKGLLFPVASQNLNRVTDNFSSLLEEQANDLGERIVFHSTRHTFITKARSQGASTPLVQQVVGHEKTGSGVTDRYTHSFQMKEILHVVDRVSY